MSLMSKIRKQKFLGLGLLLFTLAIGILIGTVINTDVSAGRGQANASDSSESVAARIRARVTP